MVTLKFILKFALYKVHKIGFKMSFKVPSKRGLRNLAIHLKWGGRTVSPPRHQPDMPILRV